jgi:hypothetical protein
VTVVETWGEERARLRREAREAVGQPTPGVRRCPVCFRVLVSTHADHDEGLHTTEWWCLHCDGYHDRGGTPLSTAAALALLHPTPVVEHEIRYDDSPWPEEEL